MSEREASRSSPRRVSVASLALVGVAVAYLAQVVAISRANLNGLLAMTPDDAYYYLETAQRVARGQGSTFDGIHQTNGFHPLWMGMTSLVAVVAHGQALIRVALLLGLAGHAVALLVAYRLLRPTFGATACAVGALVAVRGPNSPATAANGMEGGVVLLMLALLALALRRLFADRSPGSAALAGLAAAGVVLARLDTVLLMAPLAVVIVWRLRRPQLLAPALGGMAAVLVPFAVWFVTTYHQLSTVSSVMRRHEAAQRLVPSGTGAIGRLMGWRVAVAAWAAASVARTVITGAVGGQLGAVVLGGLPLLVALVVVVAKSRRSDRAHLDRSDPGLVAALLVGGMVVLGGLVDVVVVPGPWLTEWYFAALYPVCGFAAGIVLCRGVAVVRTSRPGAGWALVVVAAVGLVPSTLVVAAHARPRTTIDKVAAARWIVAHGPTGTYGSDNAGILGFLLDGHDPVVDLDGHVGDRAMAERAAAEDPLVVRARDAGVDFYVDVIVPDPVLRRCGRVLWRDPTPNLTGHPFEVIDLRGCR